MDYMEGMNNQYKAGMISDHKKNHHNSVMPPVEDDGVSTAQ